MKSAVLFDNLGPYHLARLRAAASVAEVLAVEFGARSVDYHWSGHGALVKVKTLNPNGSSWELSRREFKEGLDGCLRGFGPDVVFVPGWATPGAFLGLQWCLKNRIPAVVMSESTAWDAPRNPVREAMKRWVLSHFSAALVGGQPQKDYVLELGMAAERVFTGYNIVDNAFFAEEADRVRRYAPEDRRSEKGDGGAQMAEGGGSFEPHPGAWAVARETAARQPEGLDERERTSQIPLINTDERGGAGPSSDKPSGTAFSNSFPSQLARDSENTTLTCSAGDHASLPATSYQPPVTAPEEPLLDARRSSLDSGLPVGPYFLASSRFIPKKNLFALLEEYAKYCAACAAQEIEDGRLKIEERKSEEKAETLKAESGKSPATSDSPLATSPIGEKRRWVWPLVLLGDGELREQLVRRIGELGLRMEFRAPWEEAGRGAPGDRRLEIGDRMEADGEGMADGGRRRADGGDGVGQGELDTGHWPLDSADRGLVFLPGFRQVEELPRFYAEAGAFVHASLSEQWGLVVNEAMACALPVLVSDQCGCAKDLVQDGVNGYTFVVYPMIRLAEKFSLISGMSPVERVKMGLRGREIIKGWGAEAFAKGFLGAAKAALTAPRRGRSFFFRAVLEAFSARQLR